MEMEGLSIKSLLELVLLLLSRESFEPPLKNAAGAEAALLSAAAPLISTRFMLKISTKNFIYICFYISYAYYKSNKCLLKIPKHEPAAVADAQNLSSFLGLGISMFDFKIYIELGYRDDMYMY